MNKKRPIIVHVGSGKCGSTSLQHALIQNKHALIEQGYEPFTHYDFPQIVDAALSGYKRHNLPFEDKYIKQANAINVDHMQVAQEINKTLLNSKQTPILSSEYFFEMNSERRNERLKFLKHCLKGFDHVTILLYFRAPDDYIRSLYIQWFTPTFPVSFEEFSTHFDYKQSNAFFSFDFKSHLTEIETLIQPNEMHFELLHNIDKDDHILDNFLKLTIGNSFSELTYKKDDSNITLNSGDFSILYNYKNLLTQSQRKNLLNFLKRYPSNLKIPSYLFMNRSEIQCIFDYTMPIFKSIPKLYRPNLSDFEEQFKNRICRAPISLADDIKAIKAVYPLLKAKTNSRIFSMVKYPVYLIEKIKGRFNP